jgi:hypothetical protein
VIMFVLTIAQFRKLRVFWNAPQKELLGSYFVWNYNVFEHLLCEWRKAVQHTWKPPEPYAESGRFQSLLPFFP